MKPSFYFYANPYQTRSVEAARALAQAVEAAGGKVLAEKWLADSGVGAPCELKALPADIRALVAFGGDGTLLRAAQEVMDRQLPLLGVHTGTVGFLMPGRAEEPQATAALLMEESYPIEAFPLLQVRCEGKEYRALNDLALARGEHPGVIEVTALADGEEVFCAHGDGVVVSTPLGATAYGLSAGGPIVRPDAPCLLLTPLCARELLLRPVILPFQAHITLLAHGRDRRRLQLALDGQTLVPITHEVQIQVSLAPESALLIRPEKHCFFDTLRKKQAIWNQQEKQE